MSDHDTTPEAAELTHIQLGGWDGDLLVGYTRGSLSMPFLKV